MYYDESLLGKPEAPGFGVEEDTQLPHELLRGLPGLPKRPSTTNPKEHTPYDLRAMMEKRRKKEQAHAGRKRDPSLCSAAAPLLVHLTP
jgi:hypothetical protein